MSNKAKGGSVRKYRGSKPGTPEDELTVGEGAPTPRLKALRDRLRAITGDEKHDYLPRVARSLITQFSTLGPDGHPRAPGLRGKTIDNIGLVDGALSLPELIPLAGQLLQAADQAYPSTLLKDVDFGFDALANWDTPQWSKDAAERYGALDEATRIDMGLNRPQGFGEHAADALGVMAGQIPLVGPARAAAARPGVARRVLGAVPEYLGPTIKPSAGAYGAGAVGGGILGTLGGPDEPSESNATHWAEGGFMGNLDRLSRKYAGGGKVGKSAEAVKAIKNAMSHLANKDSQSAAKVLMSNKEISSDPNVKAAIDDLARAKANSASQRLNKLIESDANQMVPMLAKGGKVGTATRAIKMSIEKALASRPDLKVHEILGPENVAMVTDGKGKLKHAYIGEDGKLALEDMPDNYAEGGQVDGSFDDYVSSLFD